MKSSTDIPWNSAVAKMSMRLATSECQCPTICAPDSLRLSAQEERQLADAEVRIAVGEDNGYCSALIQFTCP